MSSRGREVLELFSSQAGGVEMSSCLRGGRPLNTKVFPTHILNALSNFVVPLREDALQGRTIEFLLYRDHLRCLGQSYQKPTYIKRFT